MYALATYFLTCIIYNFILMSVMRNIMIMFERVAQSGLHSLLAALMP